MPPSSMDSMRLQRDGVEARAGVEPANKGFADLGTPPEKLTRCGEISDSWSGIGPSLVRERPLCRGVVQ